MAKRCWMDITEVKVLYLVGWSTCVLEVGFEPWNWSCHQNDFGDWWGSFTKSQNRNRMNFNTTPCHS